MTDLHTQLPQDKCDVERAEALVALGYPTVAPLLPELVQWLQDINWPVAKVIAPFLASIGPPMIPHVRQVLETDDVEWKIWVMEELVMPSPVIYEAVQTQVWQMASMLPGNPNKHPEDEAALQEAAQRVLDHYGVSQTA